MKKIIILAYFFPPANFVGSARTSAWAKYLSDEGYYPIIITRQWNENQSDLVGHVVHNEYSVDYYEGYEVHRLPVRNALQTLLSSSKWLIPLRKVLTLFTLIAGLLHRRFLPFANFYSLAAKLILNDPAIKAVIASGRPFEVFSIGHSLKLRFKHIKWIADYRDDWNSAKASSNPLTSPLAYLMVKAEKKWVANADCITSVSEFLAERIGRFVGRPGFSIKNGYDEKEQGSDRLVSSQPEALNILYSGTMYANQRVEIFIEACKNIIASGQYHIKVYFIGSNVNPLQDKRLKKLVLGFEQHFIVLPRLSKDVLEPYMAQTDVFFMTGYTNERGFYPVKMFEYYQRQRPIVLCPPDGDTIEAFVREVNAGYIASDIDSCCSTLEKLCREKASGGVHMMDYRHEEALKYSRRYQTKLLAELINRIVES